MTALAQRVAAALVAIGMTAIGSPALAAAPARGSDGEAAENPVGVGVLPLVLAGKVAPEVGDARKRLSQRVVTGLDDPALSVVALDVAASGSADAPFCSDRACWQALSQAHGVSHLIVVVVRHSDGDYQIEGRLVDGRTGGEVGAVDNACDLCGLEELGEHVTDVARALRRELKSGIVSAPTLVVKSKPAGATVSIDGEVVGVTPLEVRTPAGQRRIDVSHDGYTNERIDVELVGGTRRVIEA